LALPPVHEMEFVLVPIHFSQNHWFLVEINMSKQAVRVYDSMKRELHDYMELVNNLKHWVKREAAVRHRVRLDMRTWDVKLVEVPQQGNTDDCGVYTIFFAEHLSLGLPIPELTPEEVPKLRFSYMRRFLQHWNLRQ
ncbi:hypothetical protein Agub_g15594, partial [Astrephomene gubernaculifera]